MTDISVIGLGLMGTALARTLHAAGHKLTVWNRSGAKMKAFEELGVACAPDFQNAVEVSDVVLICIDSYATAHGLLDGLDDPDRLKGKAVVHLTSGTPKEADTAAQRFKDAGASYLDGAILAGPDDIGTAEATLLLSGDTKAMERANARLNCLADGGVRYLGPTFGAAAALDLAWLMTRYCNFLAAAQGALICQSEGANLDEFIRLVPDNPGLQTYARVISDEGFDTFTASLRVWGEALQHICEQGRDAGINTEIPDFVAGLFGRAVDDGLGESNVMSLIKVLR